MIDAKEQVVLVDEADRDCGVMDKLEAHRAGALHRAISVFVLDRDGHLILQRRARGKYHSGGQWANACCSHPRPGETPAAAAHRRLREELGFDCPLVFQTRILYRADVGAGLVEHELVHAFIGTYDGPIAPDPAEVEECRAISMARLAQDIDEHPESYAPWLRIYIRDHRRALFPQGA